MGACSLPFSFFGALWRSGRLERFRYGPGVFKLDWALDGPVPWRAAECARAATVHLGGTLPELAASESAVWHPRPALNPCERSENCGS